MRRLLPILLLCLWSTSAWAFASPAHRLLTERALRRQVPVQTMANPTDQGLQDFWLWLGFQMAKDSPDHQRDGADPERFRARYPTQRHFAAFAIRGFLGLSQDQIGRAHV